jgi:hypothetical protein
MTREAASANPDPIMITVRNALHTSRQVAAPLFAETRGEKEMIQTGDVLTLTAPYDVLVGKGFLVGSIFAVAQSECAQRGGCRRRSGECALKHMRI